MTESTKWYEYHIYQFYGTMLTRTMKRQFDTDWSPIIK